MATIVVMWKDFNDDPSETWYPSLNQGKHRTFFIAAHGFSSFKDNASDGGKK